MKDILDDDAVRGWSTRRNLIFLAGVLMTVGCGLYFVLKDEKKDDHPSDEMSLHATLSEEGVRWSLSNNSRRTFLLSKSLYVSVTITDDAGLVVYSSGLGDPVMSTGRDDYLEISGKSISDWGGSSYSRFIPLRDVTSGLAGRKGKGEVMIAGHMAIPQERGELIEESFAVSTKFDWHIR